MNFWKFNILGEFVMEEPHKLPQPIIHMLATGPQYYSICDNLLRGYSGIDYTRMFGEFDSPYFPKNQGRTVWVRTEDAAIWPINYYPSKKIEPTKLTSVFGLGYCSVENLTSTLGLRGKITVFTPLDNTVEIWLVEISNVGVEKKILDIIPTVPIFGGSRAYAEYHRDVVRLYNKSRVTKDYLEIYPALEWVEGKSVPSDICYFMSVNSQNEMKATRFYTDRESFLGPAYNWNEPQAIKEDLPPQIQLLGKEAVGAIEFSKIMLNTGETFKFAVINGITFGEERVKDLVKRYDYEGALKAKERLDEFWRKKTSVIEVKTKDPLFDICWNKWWLYQNFLRYWFGNTGHPQFDYGQDFSGWREIWQDVMGAMFVDIEGAKKHILNTLEGVRLDGTNATRFFARTKKFGSDEINGLWCDHPYWTTQVVIQFMNLVGDIDFLLNDGIRYFKDAYRSRGTRKDLNWPAGKVDFDNDAKGKAVVGTVVEHLLVQLLTDYYDVGVNGLITQKRADWNDAVDQVKGTNTTFSMGLVQNLNDLARYLELLKAKTKIKDLEIFKELMLLIGKNNLSAPQKQRLLANYLDQVDSGIEGKKAKINLDFVMQDLKDKAKYSSSLINEVAWNGEYYIGYFHKDGTPVDTNRKGNFKIMFMPQIWAVYSGIANAERLKKLLASIDKYLYDSKVGAYKLCYPAYTKFDPTVGRISGFAPGTKENNAVFCHTNLYYMYAMLKLKMANRMFKAWEGINPLSHDDVVLRTGPWLVEYYISEDNLNYPRRSEYPMLTGTATWTRWIFPVYIFGVRPELGGLRIDPSFPASEQFSECSIKVNFRGATYEVKFLNRKRKENAVPKKILVDGQMIKNSLVKPFKKGHHHVEVTLE